MLKVKRQYLPYSRPRRPRGVVDVSSTLSLTSALDGVEGQRHTPAILPPEKTRYPYCRRKGGLQGRSGRVRKISTPTGSDPRTVHPVATRYPGPLRFYAATLIFLSFIMWCSVKLLTYEYKLVNLIKHKTLAAPPSGSTIQLILKPHLNVNI